MATFNFRASPVLLAVTAFIRPLSAIAKWLPQSVSSILEGILERTAIVRHFVRCAGNVKRRCARSLWNRLLPTRESFSFDYVITQFVLATRTFCAGSFCARLVHYYLLLYWTTRYSALFCALFWSNSGRNISLRKNGSKSPNGAHSPTVLPVPVLSSVRPPMFARYRSSA